MLSPTEDKSDDILSDFPTKYIQLFDVYVPFTSFEIIDFSITSLKSLVHFDSASKAIAYGKNLLNVDISFVYSFPIIFTLSDSVAVTNI
jgi:hypothetical protein